MQWPIRSLLIGAGIMAAGWFTLSPAYGIAYLTPGVGHLQCQSMLHPGIWTRCTPPPRKVPIQPAAAIVSPRPQRPPAVSAAPTGSTSLQARVHHYLHNYGKPPRVAVQALLDPTRANIQNWANYMHREEVLDLYLAKQLTAAEAGNAQVGADSDGNLAHFGSFYGMSLRAYLLPNVSPAVLQGLQRLAVANPGMTITAYLLTAHHQQILHDEDHWQLTYAMVPFSAAQWRALNAPGIPIFQVVDHIYHHSYWMPVVASARQLARKIMEFRQRDGHLHAHAAPAAASDKSGAPD